MGLLYSLDVVTYSDSREMDSLNIFLWWMNEQASIWKMVILLFIKLIILL